MAYLTKAQALYEADRLAFFIRSYGAKVVVDLRPGAGGGHWGVDTFWGAMVHHIASKRSQGLTPFYSLVRNGRGGALPVPGPLCNVYGGWDMVARIVTMGLANHSGSGGPWEISGFQIPKDNGRYYFLGTEFEGGINVADWTPDYRMFMGAVNAGKLDYVRDLRRRKGFTGVIKDTALCEHSSWARPIGRKIDRTGYTQASGIAEMQAARKLVLPPSARPTEPTAPETKGLFNVDAIWTFFFINGAHHVVNNVTGQYSPVPLSQVDRFTKWLDDNEIPWRWHESKITKSREVSPEDLPFVAPGGRFEWGVGQL